MRALLAVMVASAMGLAAAAALAAPGTAMDTDGAEDPAGAAAADPGQDRRLQPRPQNVVVTHRPASELPILGPRHAPVTVDFFMSLGNAQSQQLHVHLMELLQRHPRRMRVIYRLVTTERYRLLAEAAMEAQAQDRFAPFLAELVAVPRPPHTAPEIAAACARAGVRFDRVEAAWADGRHARALERNDIERQRRASHVPGLLLNGVDAGRPSRLTLERLDALYREALVLARAQLARGVPMARVYQASLRALALATAPLRSDVGAVDGTLATGEPAADPATDAAADPAADPGQLTPLLDQGVAVPGHDSGPPGAPVVVRFYCNFLSPNCALLQRALAALRQEMPTQVRLIFHHMFPSADADALPRELLIVHRASLCAAEQDAFWDFYEVMYRNFLSWRHRHQDPAEQVRLLLTALGLDEERYQACMARAGGDEAVLRRVRAAAAAGVVHTPTLVVGGRIYPGVKSLPELRVLVEQQLLPGLLEQRSPTWNAADGAFERLAN